MGYKRRNWRSGLTYLQTCPMCHTRSVYRDDSLDFRPWFPDGFVYCPTCKKPLRHNEKYAIGPDGNPLMQPQVIYPPNFTPNAPAQYCSVCGRMFNPGDNFCSGCGTKR